MLNITNYIAFNFGRPLHLYDAQKVTGDMVVRQAMVDEELIALDEGCYTLDTSMTVIADNKHTLALGGIIGGAESGCTEHTTEAFLEVALFDADQVARTGRTLQLITDSRYRFERIVDPGFLHDATSFATQMILELCGGEASELVIAGEVSHTPTIINYPISYTKKLGGIALSAEQTTAILTRLGFDVQTASTSIDALTLQVPSWRSDVSQPADIVEELLRIHGYDNLSECPLPHVPVAAKGCLTVTGKRAHLLRRVLSSRGLSEAITWSFMAEKQAAYFTEIQPSLMLANPIASDLNYMRPSIIPNLLGLCQRNGARDVRDLALYEIGSVFADTSPAGCQTHLALLRMGSATAKTALEDARSVDLYDIKSDLLASLSAMNIPNLKLTREVPDWYHPGRSAALKLGKQTIAYFGELHPRFYRYFDLKSPIVISEVMLDHLPIPRAKKSKARSPYNVSDLQAVTRDFALIVNEDVLVGDVLDTVRQCDKKLIQAVTLFDVYQGESIGEGKKSIALSVTLQPFDHTLTDAEIDVLSQRIITQLSTRFAALLRS